MTINGSRVIIELVEHELLESPNAEQFLLVHNACSKHKTEVHHIVERSQIKKSGFSKEMIESQTNKISLDYDIHRKISGYYSSKQNFTQNLRVRDWLKGKSFKDQMEFGISIMKKFIGR